MARLSLREEESAPSRPRTGFTLVELLVVITIIGVLISLLLPAVHKVRTAARATECQNRLSNIGKGILNYEGSGLGNVKPGSWQLDISPHIENNASVFVCPELGVGQTISFGINNLSHWLGGGDARKVMVVESKSSSIDIDTGACNPAVLADALAARHGGMLNVLFVGGNAMRHEAADIDPAVATLLQQYWWPDLKPAKVCP
jgi:prepilin-type N-terminal cleavage/methylation domain-containing protein/prepilin-type processing-associated H-X9-DG protein